MIHIANKIYMDYHFSQIDLKSEVLNVYIDGLGSSDFIDKENVLGYSSLSEFLGEFGTYVDAVRYFMSFNRKTIFRLKEEDLLTLYAMHLNAIYPNIDFKTFESFVRLTVLNYKLVHSQISNYGTVVRGLLANIKFPSKDELKQLHRGNRKQIGAFTSDEKQYVSFEYLLANMFSTNFDQNNVYNKEFIKRTNFVIWKSIYWDYVGVRRDILYGLYSIKNFYDIDLDLESPTIIEDLEKLSGHYLFSVESGPENVEHIKENFTQIKDIMTKHNSLIQDESFDICKFVSEYMVDGQLDMNGVKSIIEEDMKFPSSQVFGRTEFRFSMNNLIVGMIYSGKIKKNGLSL